MSLTFIEPSARPGTLNVVLYGPAGQGKTAGACSAPGPIVLGNAEGENGVRFARRKFPDKEIREFTVQSRKDLDDLELYINEGAEGAQTVILDSIGEIYSILANEYAGGGRKQIQHYGDASERLNRLTLALRDSAINVVLVCHEQDFVDQSSGTVERYPFAGSSSGTALSKRLMQRADVVGYCVRVEPGDEEVGQTEARFMAQVIAANGRHGKNRDGVLGKVAEVDLTAWVAAYQALDAPIPTEAPKARGKAKPDPEQEPVESGEPMSVGEPQAVAA